MIHFAGFLDEDEETLEVPEIELELVEVPDKNAIVLIPGGKKEMSEEIVSSIITLRGVLGTFSTKKYLEYTVYTIHGDTERKEVYAFPKSTSYEKIKSTMREVLRVQNIMGDCSGKVVVGIGL